MIRKSRRQQKIPAPPTPEELEEKRVRKQKELTHRAVVEASHTALVSTLVSSMDADQRSQTANFTPATADAALKMMEEAEKKFFNGAPQLVVDLVPKGRQGKYKLGSVRKLNYNNLDYSLADYTQFGKMLRCCVSLEVLSLNWMDKPHYRGARLDNAGLVAMLAGPPLLSVKTLYLEDEQLGPTALPSLADAFPNLEHLSMRLGKLQIVGSLEALVSLKTLSIFGLFGPEGFSVDHAHAVLGKATLAKLKERGVRIGGLSWWG